jgi:protein-S-isoprenylcysteine O-methyltransferase Ste14
MKIFEKQLVHLFFLIALLGAVLLISRTDGFLSGRFLEIGTSFWFYISITVPILHQLFVLIVWRAELHYSTISRKFGKRGFLYYAIVFFLLFLSRLITIICLSISNQGSLEWSSNLRVGIAVILCLPVLYLFYSIARYFGFTRAFGLDHFDVSYRQKTLVKQGIFKYVSNSMYTFGLLLFWVPGLLLASKAGLLAAIFSHAYIWVHYYTVELPDMKRIYGI